MKTGIARSVLAATTAAIALTTGAPAQAANTPTWQIAQTFGSNTDMQDVVALSATDAWATGVTELTNSQAAIVRHWNGTTWQAVTVPAAYRNESFSTANLIAATSANDVWAYLEESNGNNDLLHWNGTTWDRTVTLPNGWFFNSLVAISPTDYWAVAYNLNGVTPMWHFNGTSWVKVADANNMSAVTAGWAVGTTPSNNALVVQHLVGGNWVTVSLPKISLPPGVTVTAQAITVTNATNVWAFGYEAKTNLTVVGQILLHFNGTSWSRVFPPSRKVSTVDSLTPDGNGWIWLTTPTTTGVDAYHDSAGVWTGGALPASTGYSLNSAVAAWIPGTHSLWAAASETANTSTTRQGLMLKYGP